jgi:dihydrofolate reductase
MVRTDVRVFTGTSSGGLLGQVHQLTVDAELAAKKVDPIARYLVFSSTTSAVDWNARLATGDAVTEITRLKTEDGGPMDVGGATLAAAAMRAGLIDEYVIVTHPVLLGGGTPFFTALDNWVNLNLVETRTFPDGVLLTRYETRR